MKFLTLSIGLLSLVTMMFTNVAQAAEACTITGSHKEQSIEQINEYYKCARPALLEKYQSGDNEIAKEYTNWKATQTGPSAPGVHSGRYLMTYVNDIGYDQYVAYASSNVDLPIGSYIAKESFKIKKGGKLRPGPLFFMEKVGLEKAPKTDGWLYGGVKTKGTTWATSQSFCHGCHKNYSAQDSLGYPAPDVRFKN